MPASPWLGLLISPLHQCFNSYRYDSLIVTDVRATYFFKEGSRISHANSLRTILGGEKGLAGAACMCYLGWMSSVQGQSTWQLCITSKNPTLKGAHDSWTLLARTSCWSEKWEDSSALLWGWTKWPFRSLPTLWFYGLGEEISVCFLNGLTIENWVHPC